MQSAGDTMSDYLLRPAALPTWGQRASLRFLNLIGWNVRFKPLPGPHGVAVVYPHTSNWDFLIGLLGKWSIGQQFRWLAKNSLFRGPMGTVMRYWGGVPVDRSAAHGATTKLAEQMLASDWFWVAITPEGTRSYRPHWKSGFYRLALAAKVPVLVVYIDYRKKELGVVDIVELTGDEKADMAAIAQVYEGRAALHPNLAAPISLAPPREDDTKVRQA
jgi:1-acyl-sn-glycerol-3-phosphate acyltransferase